jgi:hypothetical protein
VLALPPMKGFPVKGTSKKIAVIQGSFYFLQKYQKENIYLQNTTAYTGKDFV